MQCFLREWLKQGIYFLMQALFLNCLLCTHSSLLLPQEDAKAKDSAAELDLDNVGGVFVVLFGGVGIAFIVAILEFLWNVRKVAVDEQVLKLFKIIKNGANLAIT